MCFSAPASFVVSATLLTSGGVLKQRENSKKLQLLVSTPILFGIQQFAEGLVWVGISSGYSFLTSIGTNIFTFFAYLFWPSFIPYALLKAEPSPRRRSALFLFLALGISVSLYFLAELLLVAPASFIGCCGVQYQVEIPAIVGFFYVVATCGSLLISSFKSMVVAGVVLSLSLLWAILFFPYTVTSAWCYFAAVIALGVAVHVLLRHEKLSQKAS